MLNGVLFIMKRTKVQTLSTIWLKYWNIWIENTFVCNVLVNTLVRKMSCIKPMSRVRGLSIKPRSSTICIDLSMHVHVVKD